MKIAIIPNNEKLGAAQTATEVIAYLNQKGVELYVSERGYDAVFAEKDKLYELCDIIITVGGDGTIISHAKDAAAHNKPLLGINAGRLGFLADVEKDNLELLDKLISGEYTVCNRFMLKASVYSGNKKIAQGLALNDAVIAPGTIARLLDLEVEISSDTISYRSDGVIVSTPTGSTAYSMSAGGPIIDPKVRCFALTPICSHSLTARPIIVGEDSRLVIRLPKDSEDGAIFSLDGRFCCNVDKNIRIEIEKAPYDALLINLSGNAIYKTLSLKF